MFPELEETFSVYRESQATGFSDGSFVLVNTISGLREPIAGTEEWLNHQAFPGVTETLSVDLTYAGIAQENDILHDSSAREWRVIGKPERWDGFLPHILLRLKACEYRAL